MKISVPVTILTVALNAEATISRAIESVMNQTYPDIEYILIDGASSDDTAQIARSYVEAFNSRPGRSMTVISEPDRGMYDALNKGAEMARGVIIGQINSDDWYEPDAVRIMAELYEREKYNVGWGSVNIITSKRVIVKHAKLPGRFWITTHWHHTSQFTEREVLLEHPYICENYSDDWEFFTWCYVNGKKFSAIDEIITNFKIGGMSTKKSIKEARRHVRTSCEIYRKYGFSRLYWFYKVAYETAKYILS